MGLMIKNIDSKFRDQRPFKFHKNSIGLGHLLTLDEFLEKYPIELFRSEFMSNSVSKFWDLFEVKNSIPVININKLENIITVDDSILEPKKYVYQGEKYSKPFVKEYFDQPIKKMPFSTSFYVKNEYINWDLYIRKAQITADYSDVILMPKYLETVEIDIGSFQATFQEIKKRIEYFKKEYKRKDGGTFSNFKTESFLISHLMLSRFESQKPLIFKTKENRKTGIMEFSIKGSTGGFYSKIPSELKIIEFSFDDYSKESFKKIYNESREINSILEKGEQSVNYDRVLFINQLDDYLIESFGENALGIFNKRFSRELSLELHIYLALSFGFPDEDEIDTFNFVKDLNVSAERIGGVIDKKNNSFKELEFKSSIITFSIEVRILRQIKHIIFSILSDLRTEKIEKKTWENYK